MKKECLTHTIPIMVISCLITMLLLYKCGCCGVKCPPIETKTDTTYVQIKTIDTVYIPELSRVTDTIYEDLIVRQFIKVDTAEILKDYYAVKDYSDTQAIQYGSIVINDRLWMNRNIGRGLVVEQKIPEITKTIYELKEIPTKKVNQLYGGVSLISDSRQLIPGVSFMLKNKRDNVIETGVYYNREFWYQFGLKTKISFRK